MLFVETVVAWKGLKAPSAGSYLLNTNRIGKIKTRDTDKSGFYYSLRLGDRREKPGYIDATTSVANVIVAMDDVLNSNAMLLKEYPNRDVTATPVNKYIDYADFVYAYAYEDDATKSWVVYADKSFKLQKVIVNNSLAQLEDVAESGSTTTTTTTTTTTSGA